MELVVTSNIDCSAFRFGHQSYQWRFWDGEFLDSRYLAIDCESTLIRNNQIPDLVLLAAFNGRHAYIVRPHDVATFIELHFKAAILLFWNAEFDFSLIDKHLADRGEQNSRGWLWSALDTDRVRDAMIVAALVGLAKQDNFKYFSGEKGRGPSDRPVMPSLGDFSKYQLGVELEKDEFRLRYAEIRGMDWTDLESGWFVYPAMDVVATFQAYSVVSHEAKAVCDQHQADRRFGFLTEAIMVKSSIALGYVGRRGFRVDPAKVSELIEPLNRQIELCINDLRKIEPDVFRTYRVKARKGELMANKKTGLPKTDTKVLKRHLEAVEKEHSLQIPRTSKGISDSTKLWHQHRGKSHFVDLYCSYKDTQKQRSFLHELPAWVTSRYGMVKSGRTNCYRANMQQWDKRTRDALVPDAGGLFLIVDVAAAELAALASSCLHRFGFSQLGEKLKAGIDPHAFLGSRILGVDYPEFMSLRKADMPKFKRYRSLGKAANFGLSGGLGVLKFVDFAGKPPYEVPITEQDAKRIKQGWMSTFPEMRLHLQATTNAEVETLTNQSGRVRGQMTYCSARNYVFQSTVADGQRLAIYELVRQGFTVNGFIHDELILTLSRLMACNETVNRVERIIISAMAAIIGTKVPIKLESALCERWSKAAEPVFNEVGELIPWKPNEKPVEDREVGTLQPWKRDADQNEVSEPTVRPDVARLESSGL